jgi:1-deoxy-D-xylulose-5-phosphate reductoisomerase
MPAVLNAANEIAVASFLDRGIRYTDIVTVIDHCLNNASRNDGDSLELILETDSLIRRMAGDFISQRLSN